MISVNADTGIDTSIFGSGDWDSIFTQFGIKQKLFDSTERLEAVLKHFSSALWHLPAAEERRTVLISITVFFRRKYYRQL